MEKVWLLDFGSGAERAFTTPEAAYDAAYNRLLDWGYSPDNEDEKGFFDELKETFDSPNYSGFEVDEVLWCWEVPID